MLNEVIFFDTMRQGLWVALIISLPILAVALLACLALVRAPFGKTLVAIRENEERARMLGYDVWRHKFLAVEDHLRRKALRKRVVDLLR